MAKEIQAKETLLEPQIQEYETKELTSGALSYSGYGSVFLDEAGQAFEYVLPAYPNSAGRFQQLTKVKED